MKWFGEVGYAVEVDEGDGVYRNDIVTRNYYGDILRNSKQDASNQQINNNFRINNQISVVSDPFLMENFHKIVYVTFMGTKWKVASVDVQYPRLILSIGDVYKTEGVE